MKWKSTLVLLVVTVALGAYVSLYELKRPSQEIRERLAKQLVRFDPQVVQRVTIEASHGTLALVRTDGTWRLEQPPAPRAPRQTTRAVRSSGRPTRHHRGLARHPRPGADGRHVAAGRPARARGRRADRWHPAGPQGPAHHTHIGGWGCPIGSNRVWVGAGEGADRCRHPGDAADGALWRN